jgi:sentrin-specific protease 7
MSSLQYTLLESAFSRDDPDTLRNALGFSSYNDIFNKKFVMVPVFSDIHWSLGVVVNPGMVANVENENTSKEVSCLFHLDSLPGIHKSNKIRKILTKWLNIEWNGRMKTDVSQFNRNSLPLVEPKG